MRRAVVVVLGALVMALAIAGPVRAEPPLEVTGNVTDRAGALGDGAPAVQQAAESLAAETGIGLYAVFVPSFDDVAPAEWAAQTAELSALGESDVLLVVAAGQDAYEYSWWIDDSSTLSAVEVEAAITTEVEPRLSAGDRTGAVLALAERLRPLAGSAAAQTPVWSATTTLLVVLAVAAVLLAGHLLSRRRTRQRVS